MFSFSLSAAFSPSQRALGLGFHPFGTSGRGNLQELTYVGGTLTPRTTYHMSSVTGFSASLNPGSTGLPSRNMPEALACVWNA